MICANQKAHLLFIFLNLNLLTKIANGASNSEYFMICWINIS